MVDVFSKPLNLGPVFFDQIWMQSLELRNEFRDVVNLGVVEIPRGNLSDPERFVAVVTTVLSISSIFELLLRAQVEELSANGKLPVNLFLTKTKVDNIEEAWFVSYRVGIDLVITCQPA